MLWIECFVPSFTRRASLSQGRPFKLKFDIRVACGLPFKGTLLAYIYNMEFFEAPPFTRYLRDYMADEEYVSLQFLLAQNPQLGDVMPGTGGFRKLRWADPRRGKGAARRTPDHLLPLPGGSADLVYDSLRKR